MCAASDPAHSGIIGDRGASTPSNSGSVGTVADWWVFYY